MNYVFLFSFDCGTDFLCFSSNQMEGLIPVTFMANYLCIIVEMVYVECVWWLWC